MATMVSTGRQHDEIPADQQRDDPLARRSLVTFGHAPLPPVDGGAVAGHDRGRPQPRPHHSPACAQREVLINAAFRGRAVAIPCPYDALRSSDSRHWSFQKKPQKQRQSPPHVF
jgi:hypothetical protein